MSIKIVDKKFWGYQWLLFSNGWRAFLSHFGGWKNFFDLFAVAIVGVIYQYITGHRINNFYDVLESGLGGIILWVIGVLLFYLALAPYRIYQAKEKESDKYNWNHINVKSKKIKDKSRLLGFSAGIENEKAIDITNIALEIVYLEIDDEVVYTRPTRNYQEFSGYRFPLFNDGHYDGNTFTFIKDEIADFIFIDHSNEKDIPSYRVIFCIPDDSRKGFETKRRPVEKQARCELIIYGKVQSFVVEGNPVYNFDFNIKNNKPKFSFNPGKLKYHLSEDKKVNENKTD
jgi:hypothetical protein